MQSAERRCILASLPRAQESASQPTNRGRVHLDRPPRQFSRSPGRAMGSRGARRTCSTLHAVGGGSHATHPHRAPAFPPVIAIARVESVDPSVTVCRYDDLHGPHGAGATAGAEESTAARVEEAVAAGTARAVRPQLLRRVDLGRGLHRTTVGSSVSDVRARRARMGERVRGTACCVPDDTARASTPLPRACWCVCVQ